MDLKSRAESILDYANNKLKEHEEYESWMVFEGADVLPNGNIIPRFKTKDGKSGFNEPKFPAYEQVWKDTILELGL